MSPGDLVPISLNTGLVALSYVIAVLGSFVALVAAARIRSIDAGGVNFGYVAIAAIALGGVGIWSMHFIGMQAQNFPFILKFDYLRTILSLIVAVGCSGVAMWFVARSPFSATNCLIGGFLAGIGVAGMHYIGVYAMEMPAYISWKFGLVVLSIIIAVVAASAALWLAFNVESTKQRVMASLLMGGAVCGMHYTGTAAGLVICTTPVADPAGGLGGMSLPYMTFFLSAAVLLAMRWQLWRTSVQYRATVAARMDALIKPVDKSAI